MFSIKEFHALATLSWKETSKIDFLIKGSHTRGFLNEVETKKKQFCKNLGELLEIVL